MKSNSIWSSYLSLTKRDPPPHPTPSPSPDILLFDVYIGVRACDPDYNILFTQSVVAGTMAEWLRRQTWNLMGSARVGSNPACVVLMRKYEESCRKTVHDGQACVDGGHFMSFCVLRLRNTYQMHLDIINKYKRHWFSGRIQRCQRCGPGSIPGWRIFCFYVRTRCYVWSHRVVYSLYIARWRSGSALGS